MKKSRHMQRAIVAMVILVSVAAHAGSEKPFVSPVFGEHMVLQRGKPNTIWGWTEPGKTVRVKIGKSKAETKADQDGRWEVKIQPPKAGGPYTLTIDGPQRIEWKDVLVGDVWIASGQSNMERQLGPRGGQQDIVGWKEAAAAADYPLIRQLYIPQRVSLDPEENAAGTWTVCTPETALDFTAVGFYFARDIQAAAQVPIAIIHTSWGGTPAEAWTSLEALESVPGHADAAQRLADLRNPQKILAQDKQRRDEWYAGKDSGTASAWWSVDLPAEGWREVSVPLTFEDEDFDGVVWFRKEIELPAGVEGASAKLHLGLLDDHDAAWVNGQLVGETQGWGNPRTYAVPEGILHAGRNVVAVRVMDTWGPGGWRSEPEALHLDVSIPSGRVSLAGAWQARTGTSGADAASFPASRLLNQNSPTALYNAMLHPLLRLPITGAIWYQGESNNWQAEAYEGLFATMIKDWRARWNCGDFPFLYVQIAPHKDMAPELRESQRLVLAREPNTAMAVTVDVGDAEDIHPSRKEPVGHRLALAARALAYGETIEYSGPLYKSMEVKDGQAVLHFSHVGQGLEARGGDLKGFEIAGADGAFVPAQAKIEGDAVVVSSDPVKTPVSVRYGWANVPDVNLFNKDGLPASSFTTFQKKRQL